MMIGQHVAAKATADTLFLSLFDVTNLPKVVIAAALLSIFSVIGASKVLARYGPSLLIPCAFGASAVLFVVEWMLYPSATKAIAVVIYLHVASFSAILISGFWSVVNERFDPHTAKFVIARSTARSESRTSGAARRTTVTGSAPARAPSAASRTSGLAADSPSLIAASAACDVGPSSWDRGRSGLRDQNRDFAGGNVGSALPCRTPYESWRARSSLRVVRGRPHGTTGRRGAPL